MPSRPIGLYSRTSGHVVGGVVRRPGSRATTSDAAGGLVDQVHRRLEDGDAGALGADERARDVEAVLGQQLVEVVAGDAARDLREARADQRRRSGRARPCSRA